MVAHDPGTRWRLELAKEVYLLFPRRGLWWHLEHRLMKNQPQAVSGPVLAVAGLMLNQLQAVCGLVLAVGGLTSNQL